MPIPEILPRPQPAKFETGHVAYRPDIDGLRTLAVFAVIGFHAFPGAIGGGFVGVDVFFVISGFLISGLIFDNLEKNRFSLAGFYARRIRRIFPALLLVLAACWSFGWFALLADEYRQLGKHVAGSAGFVANFVLWREAGYFDNSASTKPLLHLWSLGVEEQFYLIWPLLAWVAWKARAGFLPLILLALLASFAVTIKLSGTHSAAAFYLPLSRFWELMAGGALAHISRHTHIRLPSADREIFSILGVAMIAAAIFLIDKDKTFPGWWSLLPVTGACLTIAAGPSAWLNKSIFSSRVAVGFGLISYPLYLWHWPLLSFARIIESQTPSPGLRVVLILISFVLAWLTYELVEKPIRFGKPGRTKIAALCALMAIIGAAGYATYKCDGFGNRASIRFYQNNRNELIRTPAIDDACKAYIGRKEFPFDYCRYNMAGSDKTAAIIGDSHAHVVYPGLAELLAQRGENLVLLANSGCPTLLGSVTGKSETERKQCHDKIAQILDILTSRKDIETVYIVTRGPVYISGNGFGDAEKDERNEFLLPDVQSGPNTQPEELYRASLQRTVDALHDAGKKIYYLIENPEAGFDPAICIDRPFRQSHTECSIAKSTVLQRQSDYRTLLKTIDNVTIINPLPAFCPADNCVFMQGGTLLYADSNHLSVAGSRFLAQKVLANFAGQKP